MSANRRVDEKGRITLPKQVRERLGIEPGEEVTVELVDGEIRVRPRIEREAVRETLRGAINSETRSSPAGTVRPEDLTEQWTSDLPE